MHCSAIRRDDAFCPAIIKGERVADGISGQLCRCQRWAVSLLGHGASRKQSRKENNGGDPTERDRNNAGRVPRTTATHEKLATYDQLWNKAGGSSPGTR